MLTGRVPFQGSFTSILRKIGSEQPQKPSTINMEVAADSALERICLKMMAKAPADRFPTLAAVAEAIEEAFPREGPAPVHPSTWEKFRSATKRLFGFLRRGSSPASVPSLPHVRAPSVEGKRAVEISVTQMTAASGSDVKPIEDMAATKTTEFWS